MKEEGGKMCASLDLDGEDASTLSRKQGRQVDTQLLDLQFLVWGSGICVCVLLVDRELRMQLGARGRDHG